MACQAKAGIPLQTTDYNPAGTKHYHPQRLLVTLHEHPSDNARVAGTVLPHDLKLQEVPPLFRPKHTPIQGPRLSTSGLNTVQGVMRMRVCASMLVVWAAFNDCVVLGLSSIYIRVGLTRTCSSKGWHRSRIPMNDG